MKMGDAIPGQRIEMIGNRALAQGSRMQQTRSLSAALLSSVWLLLLEVAAAVAVAT